MQSSYFSFIKSVLARVSNGECSPDVAAKQIDIIISHLEQFRPEHKKTTKKSIKMLEKRQRDIWIITMWVNYTEPEQYKKKQEIKELIANYFTVSESVVDRSIKNWNKFLKERNFNTEMTNPGRQLVLSNLLETYENERLINPASLAKLLGYT